MPDQARHKQLLSVVPGPLQPHAITVGRRLLAIGGWLRSIPRFGLRSFLVSSANVARENRSVAGGIAVFRRASGVRAGADYVLRRNIHRIEKGLISRPRRSVFANDYIEETVEHFVSAAARADMTVAPRSELAWAGDVLDEYFRVVGSSAQIDRARSRYRSVSGTLPQSGSHELTPYLRAVDDLPPVSYESLLALSVRRRSVRWFEDREVPRQAIDDAMAVAAESPSACNRQPFEFRVYDKPAEAKLIASLPGGAAGFLDSLPAVVAVVGTLDAFFSDRDRHIIYIDASLAAMSFMLALETLGLSSCVINTPGYEAAEMRLSETLGLAEYERPVMLIALGYPDVSGMVPRSQKKELDKLRRYLS